jgi:hypothetical protein
MKERQLNNTAKEVLRLGVVATMALMAIGLTQYSVSTPIAEASVAADKHDDGKHTKDSKHHDDDRGEDFVLNGQVLEINTRKDPPEMIVGTVDGRALVRVLKTDEIVRNGVGVGDSVELTGEKVNELLFEATEISVSERTSGADHGAHADNDNSDDSE